MIQACTGRDEHGLDEARVGGRCRLDEGQPTARPPAWSTQMSLLRKGYAVARNPYPETDSESLVDVPAAAHQHLRGPYATCCETPWLSQRAYWT
jgi:hypothetical protein